MTVEIRLFLLQKTKITSCLLTHIFVYLHTHCSRMFQNVLKMVKFRLHRQGGIIKSLLRVFGSHLKISDFLQIRLQHNLINAFNIRWQSSFLHCCLCEKKKPKNDNVTYKRKNTDSITENTKAQWSPAMAAQVNDSLTCQQTRYWHPDSAFILRLNKTACVRLNDDTFICCLRKFRS